MNANMQICPQLKIETFGSDPGHQFDEVTPGAQAAIAGSECWAITIGFTDQDEALAAINKVIGRDWEHGGKWPKKVGKHSTLSSGGSGDDNAQYSRVIDYLPDPILHPASVTSSSSSLVNSYKKIALPQSDSSRKFSSR